LGGRIKSVLKEKGIGRVDAVARMGWRNQAKGLRALDRWTTGENVPHGDQWERLAALLGVPVEELKGLAERDREALLAAMDRERIRDPRYYLDIRIVGFVCKRVYFPGAWTVEQSVAASKPELDKFQPRDYRATAACLNAPDNETYLLDSDGRCFGHIHGPGCRVTLGQRQAGFVFSSDGPRRPGT
jgi:hypothetical protein